MAHFIYIILIFLLSVLNMAEADLTCKDNKGNTVDWFIMYKMPQDEHSPHPTVKEGYAFFYMDVNNPSWIFSEASLKDPNQAVGYTLGQVYKESSDIVHVMYNDEKPTGQKTSTYGHTKGVLASDKSKGFWLIHSVPKFPNASNESYDYPDTARRYGQSFLCISLDYKEMDKVGILFTYNHPWVYDSSIPDAFQDDLPNLVKVVNDKQHVESPPWYISSPLMTSGQQKFQAFAKYNNFHADLYDGLIAPYYQTDLLTETWPNGKGKLESNCSGTYKVYDNDIVVIGDITVKESADHSKWAVTANSSRTIVCIGDINREVAQMHRGGGTVCLDHPKVHQQFFSIVNKVELCPSEFRVKNKPVVIHNKL